ncbi:hypothetical protein TBLA_0C05350 [Henningerozyma blattae CBS 6284]|uniref:Uncharacterized protein n=1 Tax=Henningerozyma blattae (strain ATCC 34711 / CBS 6284 / DSM 70876 / NBRC 10599 / NRRL Y-10934 / UCD 77-7) TaxID=1071380 RepID=I2H1T0_HENB6|nr:hypothetical protein TBLA_0C05350 [Tetrapisispora blattae CBS 6284]CCH60332.1 hypothetical protein TBLA_0C05350 [Tetrapisispora blattae CBS 6284]
MSTASVTPIVKTVYEKGKTTIALTKDNKLCATNKSGLTKVINLNDPEEEPETFETSPEYTSITCDYNSDLIMTTFGGDLLKYNVEDGNMKLLARKGLPLRDSVVVHSGKSILVGGDELELGLISIDGITDNNNKISIPEQINQLSYSSKTNILAVSYINGLVEFYSLSSLVPNKVHSLDGYISKNSYNDEFRDKILTKMSDDLDDSDLDDNLENTDTPIQDDSIPRKLLAIKDHEFMNENRLCTRTAWHPNGLLFALPCDDASIKLFNIKNYTLDKTLSSNNKTNNKIIDLKFDPLHGNFIASIDINNNLTLWNHVNSTIHYSTKLKYNITNFVWKLENDSKSLTLILGTWNGSIVELKEIAISTQLEDSSNELIGKSKDKNLFVNSDDEADDDYSQNRLVDDEAKYEDNDDTENLFTQDNGKRKHTYNDELDFIDDDDGAGYIDHAHREYDHSYEKRSSKRRNLERPNAYHLPYFKYKPISQGSTPFGTNDRRYLTMNGVGYVTTVRNAEQNSVTVSFFDLGRFNEYHFEDLFGFDTCFLNENSVLFGQSKTGQIHFRPHNSLHSNWTKFIPLQKGEIITCLASTSKRVYIGTSLGYLRTFNQYGLSINVEKLSPIVSIAVQDYRIFTVHYSNTGGISYSLSEQTPKSIKYFQREYTLPLTLPKNKSLYNSGQDEEFEDDSEFLNFNPFGIKGLFFSMYGDPCIFGADDVLLVLANWRSSLTSRWIPVLDTNMELWKLSGGKKHTDVHVWPLSLANDTLNCILVKGKKVWPEFPLPLPSEMELRIPILVKSQILEENNPRLKRADNIEDNDSDENNDANQEEEKELQIPVNLAAEEEFLRSKILSGLLTDTLENDGELYGNESQILSSLNASYDKALLRLFATACSERHGEKALSIVQELKQDRALAAAVKICERADMMSLMKRINDIREARFQQTT